MQPHRSIPSRRGGRPSPSDARDRRPAGRRLPILPVAVAVVALLPAARCSCRGYSMGRQSAAEPARRQREDRLPAVLGHVPHDHRPLRRRRGRPDAIVQGAIRGMIDSLERPVLVLPDLGRVPREPAGHQRRVRGDRRRDRDAGLRRHAGLFARSGPTCRLVIVAPIGGSPAEKAGLRPATCPRHGGVPLDGLSVDGARERMRGPKGTIVALDPAGHRRPFELPIIRDIIQEREVESQRPADEPSATSGSRASPTTPRTSSRRRYKATWRPVGEDHPRPAREPGRVRHGGSRRSRASSSGPARSSGSRMPTGTTRDGRHPGGAATDPTSGSSSYRPGQRFGERDRRRGAPGDGRATLVGQTVVRKGHGPAMAGARRRGRGLPV